MWVAPTLTWGQAASLPLSPWRTLDGMGSVSPQDSTTPIPPPPKAEAAKESTEEGEFWRDAGVKEKENQRPS